jgi:cytochrome d ubiquinol oxidase subunit I
MWLVAGASNLSAIWILTANGWMQNPVGFAIRNGRAELQDFGAVIFNKFSLLQIFHVLPAALVLAAFFVMGISAYHLLNKQHIDFFSKSFKIGLTFGLIFSIFVALEGDFHARHVTEVQPAKLAAMESLWETTTQAPIHLIALPSAEEERNIIQIGSIPGVLSFLGHHDFNAEIKGLKDFPKDERPPVLLTFVSFRMMVALGTYFILVTIIGLLIRNKLLEYPLYLKLIMFSVPLPYLAIEFGWLLAEVGRQPWIVYGIMKTTDGVSPIALSQVATSLVAFVMVYALLGAVGYYLIIKKAVKGPEPV